MSVRNHAAHERHIQHQATVAHGEPGDVVTAAFDAQGKTMLARKIHTHRDIGNPQAARNQTGSAVDHRVPNGARLVVTRFTRFNKHTAEAALKFFGPRYRFAHDVLGR